MKNLTLIEAIKKLRKITGAGITKCKKSLLKNKINVNEAINWLLGDRALNNEHNEKNYGIICVYNENEVSSMIEINTQSESSSGNKEITSLAIKISKLVINYTGDIEKIKNTFITENDSVETNLNKLGLKLNETIQLRKIKRVERGRGNIISTYIHNVIASGENFKIGKIGVLVKLEFQTNSKYLSQIEKLGHEIAMHIAITKPTVKNEKSTLLEEIFLINNPGEKNIQNFIRDFSIKINSKIEIIDYTFFWVK